MSCYSLTKKTFCGQDVHKVAVDLALTHVGVMIVGLFFLFFTWLDSASGWSGWDAIAMSLFLFAPILIDVMLMIGRLEGKGENYVSYLFMTVLQAVWALYCIYNLLNPVKHSFWIHRYYELWLAAPVVLVFSLASLLATIRSMNNLSAAAVQLPLHTAASKNANKTAGSS
ncbi:hypothetical protein M3Y99_01132200 [Aphelenchoides fujianensis]|nr:hypothetical protein M3Y99_01132200 [Aphelenchoides fujianensis]